MVLKHGLNNNNLPYREVDLFEQMLLDLKHYYGATVVAKKTHQHYVTFDAVHPISSAQINIRREISDLLIVVYSPSRHIARATFLQAKVARNGCGLNGAKFNFDGQYFQYYLLSKRPMFRCANCGFPYDVLRNAYLSSIGSYGIFYKDMSGKVNFAYQPADLLLPQPPYTNIKSWHFECDNSKTYYSPKGIPDLYCTYDIDVFEKELINLRLGSPITINRRCWPHPHFWWHHLVHSIVSSNQSDDLIHEVLMGVDEFDEFLILNEERFLSEYRERPLNLSAYEEVRNLNIPLAEYNEDNVRGEEQLCRGSYSFALINIDKIHPN